MAITFSPRVALAGFDPAARWQMVPVKGERLLTLEGAFGLVPRVLDPKVLEVEQTVSGKTTLLKLKGGKRPARRLSTGWRRAAFPAPTDGLRAQCQREEGAAVPTSFHYVVDPIRRTERNIDESTS